jgi:hypothetical protein
VEPRVGLDDRVVGGRHLKWILKEYVVRVSSDSTGSEQDTEWGSYEHANELVHEALGCT